MGRPPLSFQMFMFPPPREGPGLVPALQRLPLICGSAIRGQDLLTEGWVCSRPGLFQLRATCESGLRIYWLGISVSKDSGCLWGPRKGIGGGCSLSACRGEGSGSLRTLAVESPHCWGFGNVLSVHGFSSKPARPGLAAQAGLELQPRVNRPPASCTEVKVPKRPGQIGPEEASPLCLLCAGPVQGATGPEQGEMEASHTPAMPEFAPRPLAQSPRDCSGVQPPAWGLPSPGSRSHLVGREAMGLGSSRGPRGGEPGQAPYPPFGAHCSPARAQSHSPLTPALARATRLGSGCASRLGTREHTGQSHTRHAGLPPSRPRLGCHFQPLPPPPRAQTGSPFWEPAQAVY